MQSYYDLAIAIVSFGAATFWWWSTIVRLEPWKDSGGSRANDFATNLIIVRQWSIALQRQSRLNAIAAGLSALAAVMIAAEIVLKRVV